MQPSLPQRDYENESVFRVQENKPDQTQFLFITAENAERRINHELTRTDTNKGTNNKLVRIRENSWQKSAVFAISAVNEKSRLNMKYAGWTFAFYP